MAVHYLTSRHVSNLPGAITMDADFGISLGASGGQYGTICSDLSGVGFKWEQGRFVRKHGKLNIYLDFLTEAPPLRTGTRTVDDIQASVFPAINRALATKRIIKVSGKDVYGGHQNCEIPVADAGALLVLKLNAFGGPIGRRLPKDAYDILLLGKGFIDGPSAAIEQFQLEGKYGNPGFQTALNCLRKDFFETSCDGPIRAAEFFSGDKELKAMIRQDVVTLARFLLQWD